MNKGKRSRARGINRRVGYYDYNLLAVVILLICFGLVMLYSASAYEAATSSLADDMYYFRRQALYDIVAVGLAIFISTRDYHSSVKHAPLFYIISLVLMVMVKTTPLGRSANGARRWLYLGVQFQPSEIAKITVILLMTHEIVRIGKNISRRKSFWGLLVIGLVPAFCAYYFTENLSTGLIILGICVLMIFVAHPKTKPFLIWFGIISGILVVALFYLRSNISNSSSFRLRRILVWLHPEQYAKSDSFQVIQGLYAIGSGGFFGKGLGNSAQKLSTIPEAQNDMIFSIICEELGLFGAIIVLILFGYLLYRLFFIAQNARDLYGSLIACGVFIHISLQVILNICVVLNVIPTTGVTLPFVSYGGTSLIFLMFEIGLSLSVARQIEWRDEPEKAGAANEYQVSERNLGKQQ
ncbi:MAG: FtsW/RodA/SpoVE family cell cycle protein [Bilifractor sp.]|jgi:cell division protein FtsW